MKHSAFFLSFLGTVIFAAAADPVSIERSWPVAPPPAVRSFAPALPRSGAVRALSAIYSIGDPSPEEQLYLELINRARANPPAEGVRLAALTDPQVLDIYAYYNIDLALLQSQFASLGATQPLALNANLISSARRHSVDMLTHVFQNHNGSDGSTFSERILDTGYGAYIMGENIYSQVYSVEYGHAGFEVDWGGPSSNGGMQDPPGHRNAIHDAQFREVGIGVLLGDNQLAGTAERAGPQVVTQDFGTTQNSTPLITGVAYYDVNGNGFYDVGEGIGNLRVSVTGSSYEGVTARSGGYAVPVPGNGSYTITFSGPGLSDSGRTVAVSGSKNLKVDFVPPYNAPAITGTLTPTVGRNNLYSIAPVGGASEYQWRSSRKVLAAVEGAENDTNRVVITQSAPYDVFEGIVVKSGSFAFHLVTPSGAARAQYITLRPTYLLNANSSLAFQSRLGFSTPDQHGVVQISTDEGANWVTVFSQAGDTDHPETDWHARTVSLASYAGKSARVRFVFDFARGSYVTSSDLNSGWLIDDIQLANAQEIIDETITPAIGTTFQFQPQIVGDFSLQARARAGHSYLEWGPPFSVRSTPPSGTPELHVRVGKAVEGQLQFEVELVTGATPGKLTLESKGSLDGEWGSETVEAQLVSTFLYRLNVAAPSGSQSRFYRVRAE